MSSIDLINHMSARFAYLKRITVDRVISGNDCSNYSVEIVLCEYPNYSDEDFKIIFQDVHDLIIGNIENLFQFNLMIKNVSDWQLEDTHFKVVEENGLISFYCREIRLQ